MSRKPPRWWPQVINLPRTTTVLALGVLGGNLLLLPMIAWLGDMARSAPALYTSNHFVNAQTGYGHAVDLIPFAADWEGPVAASLWLVTACASRERVTLIYPPSADLAVEAKPVMPPEAVGSEARSLRRAGFFRPSETRAGTLVESRAACLGGTAYILHGGAQSGVDQRSTY